MRFPRLFAHLQLTRPANIVTAIADIWAGFAIAGEWDDLFIDAALGEGRFWTNLAWLSLSTIGLYGGGVAFNDVFDSKLDAFERPERPIPSGRASRKSAAWMASSLLILGVLAAAQVSPLSAVIAAAIAVLAVVYDYWGKHQFLLGPINMGLCRTGNLLLGISVSPVLLEKYFLVGLIPLIYVAAITMISRGEVHGKNKKALFAGFGMFAAILAAIFILAYGQSPGFWFVLPFLGLLGYMIFPPLLKAIAFQEPKLIGKSVKAAVISLNLVNASLATAFSGWPIGLVVLILLPISLWLAKKFAVT